MKNKIIQKDFMCSDVHSHVWLSVPISLDAWNLKFGFHLAAFTLFSAHNKQQNNKIITNIWIHIDENAKIFHFYLWGLVTDCLNSDDWSLFRSPKINGLYQIRKCITDKQRMLVIQMCEEQILIISSFIPAVLAQFSIE